MTAYSWQPIEDLPDNWRDMASSELAGLIQVWKEQHTRLEQTAGVQLFNERLRREWSIETGIIENLYSIDRGTTALLIDKGLEASLIAHGTSDKPAEQIIAILRDQEDALAGLFDFISKRRRLSTAYIKELHAALTRHQVSVHGKDSLGRNHDIELLRGEYKKWPNNPTRSQDTLLHEYCPPEHVASEMDRLVAMHLAHEQLAVPPEVEAAWLHHRFTQIHPFQDGNGRMARLLASLVFLRGYCFPLLIHRENRDRYITACEQADLQNLLPMISLFISVQKRTFIKILGISQNIIQSREPEKQMLDAIRDRLITKQHGIEKDKRLVFSRVHKLEDLCKTRFTELAEKLNETVKLVNQDNYASSIISNPETDNWFKNDIVAVAGKLQYYADTGSYRSWIRLKIRETRQVDMIISFHSLGYEFTGVIAASAFIEYRDQHEDDEISHAGPYPLCNEVFEFTYTEQESDYTPRFQTWLDEVILTGLDQWRRSL